MFADVFPGGIPTIDCAGHCLAPGLVDMRVQIREPGAEHKGTIKSAGMSATAGGVTTMAFKHGAGEDMSVVEFVARRARLIGLSKIYPYAAVTKGLEGKEITEMGAIPVWRPGFHRWGKAIANAQVLRRALTYAGRSIC